MDDDRSPIPPVEITLIAGAPTAAELAAVTAVLTGMAQEDDADAKLEQIADRSAWRRHQVSVREPIRPGPGAWLDAAR